MSVIAPKTGMTRAEAYAWVVALRADGWTYKRIAAELCVSRSYVHELIVDPAGDRARARKRRAGGVCEDCGAATSYGKPGEGPARRCGPCRKKLEKAACYWTDERCLDAAREWRRRFGDWPTATEWRRANTIDGFRFPTFSSCYTPDPHAPSEHYERPWRSWSAFLVAAGADPDDVGMARAARAGTAALARFKESRRSKAVA